MVGLTENDLNSTSSIAPALTENDLNSSSMDNTVRTLAGIDNNIPYELAVGWTENDLNSSSSNIGLGEPKFINISIDIDINTLIDHLVNKGGIKFINFISSNWNHVPFDIRFVYDGSIIINCQVTKHTYSLILIDFITNALYTNGISEEEYNPIVTVYFTKGVEFITSKSVEINKKSHSDHLKASTYTKISSTINKRYYSTKSLANKTVHSSATPNIGQDNMFSELASYFEANKFKADKDIQLGIEHYLSDHKFTKKDVSLLHDVFSNLLGGEGVSTLNSNALLIKLYITKLLDTTDKNKPMFNVVLKRVGKDYIFDLCLYIFLNILTHSNTDNDDMFSVV